MKQRLTMQVVPELEFDREPSRKATTWKGLDSHGVT